MRSEEPVQVVLPQEPVPPGVFSRWSCVGDLENLATNPDTLRTCIFHNVCHEHGDWLYYERQPQAALPAIFDHKLGPLPYVLSCARRTVLEAGNGTGAQHDHEPTRQGHESGLSQQVT